MKNIYDWLDAYGESHQNPTNKKIHWVCVPLIMITLLGLLSFIKFPISISQYIPINLSSVLIILALIFYLRLSISIFNSCLKYLLSSKPLPIKRASYGHASTHKPQNIHLPISISKTSTLYF